MAAPPPSTATAAQVESAIRVMYSLTDAPLPPAKRNEAVKWLVDFSNTPTAWLVYPQLLRCPVTDIQFYAANGLYSKVRSDWHALTADQRGVVLRQLWGALDAATHVERRVLGRVCLALGCAALHTPGGLTPFVMRVGETCTGFLTAAGQSADRQAPAPLLGMCAELLLPIPQLLEDLPLSHKRSSDARAEAHSIGPRVVSLLQRLVLDPASSLRVQSLSDACRAAAAAAGPLGSPARPLPAAAQPQFLALTAAFNAASAWLSMTNEPAALVATLPPLMQAVLSVLTSIPNAQLCRAAATLLAEMLHLAASCMEHTEGLSVPDSPLGTLCAARLAEAVPYFHAQVAGGQYEVAKAYAEAVACVLDHGGGWAGSVGAAKPHPNGGTPPLSTFPFVAACIDGSRQHSSAPTVPTVAGGRVGLGVLLCDVWLQAAASPVIGIASAVTDGLMSLSCVPVEERHPFFRKPLYRIILHVLANQCMLRQELFESGDGSGGGAGLGSGGSGASRAGGGAGGSPDFDSQAFLEFRATTQVDVLRDCLYLLQQDTLPALLELITMPAGAHIHGYAAALPAYLRTSPPWVRLEAVLTCLHVLREDFIEQVEEAQIAEVDDAGFGDGGSSSSGGGGGAGGGGSSVDGSWMESFIGLIHHAVTAAPPRSLPPELAVTTCKWLGGLADWMSRIPAGTTLRYSKLFGDSGDGSGAAAVHASFSLLPVAELKKRVFQFLFQALEAVEVHARYMRKPVRDSVATALAVVSGGVNFDSRRGGSSGGLGGGLASEDGDGDDDEEEPEDERDHHSLSYVAAVAITALGRRGMEAASLLPPALAAFTTAAKAGLRLPAKAKLVDVLVTLALQLPPAAQQAALRQLLEQPVALITTIADKAAAAAAAAPAAPPAPLPAPQEAALACEVAVLHAALMAAEVAASHTSFADTEREEDAWTGGPGASPTSSSGGGGGSAADRSAANLAALAPLVAAVWPKLDAIVPHLARNADTVSLLLRFYTLCVRLYPSQIPSRMPRLMPMCLHLYSTYLHTTALSTIQYALLSLKSLALAEQARGGGSGTSPALLRVPGDGAVAHAATSSASTTVLPPPVVAAFADFAHKAAIATCRAAAQAGGGRGGTPPPLADHPDAAAAFLSFCTGLCTAAPMALLPAATVPADTTKDIEKSSTLKLSIMLLGPCLQTASHDVCRSAAEYLRAVSGCIPALPIPPPVTAELHAAIRTAAGSVAKGITAYLVSDTAQTLVRSYIVDVVGIALSSQAARAVAEALVAAFNSYAEHQRAGVMAAAAADPSQMSKLQAAAADGTPLLPGSGLLSLTEAERRGTVVLLMRNLHSGFTKASGAAHAGMGSPVRVVTPDDRSGAASFHQGAMVSPTGGGDGRPSRTAAGNLTWPRSFIALVKDLHDFCRGKIDKEAMASYELAAAGGAGW